ncbi:MAG TPA: ABC transporter ATP-binding protein [Candidatus Paceibacterota bacterium]|nr:ABC transporter ATP-binding protein [Candidatus Paceibacterota bacterium]
MYIGRVFEHPWLFAVLFVSVIALQATELIAPLYLRTFFNQLATNTPTAAIMHGLFITLTLYAVVTILGWALRRIMNFSIMYMETAVMTRLYSIAFDYLIGHAYHFFTNQFAGTLTRRVSKFAGAFEALFDSVMFQFFPTLLFVVGATAILFVRNHTLGIMLGVWIVLFVSFQVMVARWRQPLRVARSEEDSRLVGGLSDAISNQNTITLFSGAAFESSRFRGLVQSWRKATQRSWNADEYVWIALGFLMSAINIALLYGALIYWQRGLVTIGDFVLIQAYLLTTFDSLIGINRELRRFYDAFADAVEMATILETPHEIADAKGAAALAVMKGDIDFSDVSFRFVEDRPLLTDFNLSIAGGEKVALVGPSGAGKSTITRLILRYYDVTGGAITIDGQNIKEITQDSLRDAIAFVPQEPILFHRTLMENIRYGRRDATDAEVIEAAKQAHCHDFIMATPEKYETYVGERGIKLSGGERQRVAIARAILKNAPILILDEATSSLDSESEMLIQDALARLMEGKTVIAIAHRLSTVMKMDRIMVIEDGKIAMTGTHQELVAHEGGLYKKLWEIQAGGFIEDDTQVQEH